MPRISGLRFSMRTLLIVTAAIATYMAMVISPRLQNKHAIDVIVFKHDASFGAAEPGGPYGPLWVRAMLPAEYSMAIDWLYFDSPDIDDSALAEIARAVRHLPTPVRHIELHGTKVTASGLEKLRLSLPDCDVIATPIISPAGRTLPLERSLESSTER